MTGGSSLFKHLSALIGAGVAVACCLGKVVETTQALLSRVAGNPGDSDD